MTEQEADPDGIFWNHNEGKEESAPDRTEGEYRWQMLLPWNYLLNKWIEHSFLIIERVWLPDGRLKIVSYYVDGESGFVPTITYEDNYVPSF